MSTVSELRQFFLTRCGNEESASLLNRYLASPSNDSSRRLISRLFAACPEAKAGEYTRTEVLCGVLEEALEFAAERGFTPGATFHFLQLFLDTLELLSCERTLSSVVTSMKELAQSHSHYLSPPFLLLSANYITTTLLRHHHLYRYLLTDTQPTDVSRIQLSVIPPVPPPLLQTGTSLSQWQRETAIKQLETAQAEKRLQCTEAGEMALEGALGRLKDVYDTELSKLDGSHDSTEVEVTKMVATLTQAHVEQTHTAILQEMAKNELDVCFQLETLEVLTPRQQLPGPPTPRGKAGKESRGSKTPQTPSRQK